MNTESKKETIADRVQKELTARDKLVEGLSILRTRKQELEDEITSNSIKRHEIAKSRLELLKVGGSDIGIDAEIAKSKEQESTNREEIDEIERMIPADGIKLKTAETVLKRATLSAI